MPNQNCQTIGGALITNSPLCSWQKFLISITIAFLFVFNKYCLIMNYPGLTDLSRKLQANYIISFYFRLYLMLHTYGVKIWYDKKSWKFYVLFLELNNACVSSVEWNCVYCMLAIVVIKTKFPSRCHPCLSLEYCSEALFSSFQKLKTLFSITSNFVVHIWSVKYRWKKNNYTIYLQTTR